jgi:segregation and condensation protein B
MAALQPEARSLADDSPRDLQRTTKMARLEAALFVADGALSIRRLAQLATLADAAEVRRLVDSLNACLTATNSAFHIERVGTGYQILTLPEFAPWLDKLHQRQTELQLSPPAMESLTIVAYRQPITRADIEAIRGVQSTEMLKQLMERGLVRIAGEDDSLGRPYLYGTTPRFLELFGLRTLDDLPNSELKSRPTIATKEDVDQSEDAADAELEDAELEDAELEDAELEDAELEDAELEDEAA